MEELIDFLTDSNISIEERKEMLGISSATTRAAMVIISAEAVIERNKQNKNDAEETRRLNKKYGTEVIEMKATDEPNSLNEGV